MSEYPGNAILFLLKHSVENYRFPYINCEELNKLLRNDNQIIVSNSSLGKTWRLVDNRTANLLKNLLSKGQTLGSFSKISNGIKSGEDSVFIINNDGNITVENNLLKDYLKNSEIHKYYTDKPKRKIIYSTSNIKIDSFPKFKKYILQYKEKLEKKWNSRGELNDFWKLYRPREDIYTSDNGLIITPYRAKKISFSFNNGCFSGTDTYLIRNTSKNIHEKTLLGILNSKLIFWIFDKLGKKKGNIFEIATKELCLLPIIFPDKSIANMLNKYVDNIMTLKYSDNYEQYLPKQANVREYEEQIDQLVYELYGLTVEDIKIVEGETK